MISICRKYAFCASHRLHVPSLSENENKELFGKCNHPFGHGHNYVLEVRAAAEIKPETGFAVEIDKLDRLVQTEILARYDHRYLNAELPEFAATVPTTENLGAAVARLLGAAWPSHFPTGHERLEGVRIFETPRNIIEVACP